MRPRWRWRSSILARFSTGSTPSVSMRGSRMSARPRQACARPRTTCANRPASAMSSGSAAAIPSRVSTGGSRRFFRDRCTRRRASGSCRPFPRGRTSRSASPRRGSSDSTESARAAGRRAGRSIRHAACGRGLIIGPRVPAAGWRWGRAERERIPNLQGGDRCASCFRRRRGRRGDRGADGAFVGSRLGEPAYPGAGVVNGGKALPARRAGVPKSRRTQEPA